MTRPVGVRVEYGDALGTNELMDRIYNTIECLGVFNVYKE